jgi:DNA ligase-1
MSQLPFARLAACFDELEQTASRNAMVAVLAALFKEAAPEPAPADAPPGAAGEAEVAEAREVDKIVYLSQGRLVPPFERLEFGVGEALLREALATAAGVPVDEVRRRFVQVGDYGTLAALLFEGRQEGKTTVAEVYEGLYAVATASGKGAQAQKKSHIVAVLKACGPREAKHVARILMGRLRLGIGDPTMMDALSYARTETKTDRKPLERAYNLCSDLGLVARTYLGGRVEALETIHVQVGKPVRPALAERVASPEELIQRLGRCAVEPKIDGFRLQVHKPEPDGGDLHAYSRNLEDMSEMFPEVVDAIREQARGHTLILEGEAVGYDPASLEFHPFQVTVQRRRKYDIDSMRQTLPLKLIAFDLLYLDGEDQSPLPYHERRRRLLELLGPPIDFTAAGAAAGPVVQPNDMRELGTAAELEAFFATTVERGQEGIVAKRLDAPYQAGARNFNWIKLKRSYRGELQDTVDCVVVGYWYGKGHRARLGIGTILTAVYDKERDVFTTVTRLGTGFSEAEWLQLRELLDAIREPDRPARVESVLTPDVWCLPRYVVEIQADEITRSPMHTAGRGADGLGYALRFPRVLGFVRADRRPEDATTVEEVIGLYRKQGRRAVEAGGL